MDSPSTVLTVGQTVTFKVTQGDVFVEQSTKFWCDVLWISNRIKNTYKYRKELT